MSGSETIHNTCMQNHARCDQVGLNVISEALDRSSHAGYGAAGQNHIAVAASLGDIVSPLFNKYRATRFFSNDHQLRQAGGLPMHPVM